MIMTRPRRRITRHLSHIFLTEGLTFTFASSRRRNSPAGNQPVPWLSKHSLVPVNDPPARQVVWRQRNQYSVAWEDPDVVHPHLP